MKFSYKNKAKSSILKKGINVKTHIFADKTHTHFHKTHISLQNTFSKKTHKRLRTTYFLKLFFFLTPTLYKINNNFENENFKTHKK